MAKCFFEGSELQDKNAIKILKKAKQLKLINDTSEAISVLCSPVFPTNGSFIVCTNSEAIHALYNGIIFKPSRYFINSITGVSTKSVSVSWTCPSIIIGGGQEVVLEVKADPLNVSFFVDYLNRRLSSSSSTPTTPVLSVADEIKKYKELLDLGAITQDEYDKKKTELLG